MDDREFIIMLWRGLKIMADDAPPKSKTQRGILLMVSAIEQKYELKKAPPKMRRVSIETRTLDRTQAPATGVKS